MLREEFLKEWVSQATQDEIVKMLVLNDERAKKIEKIRAILKEPRVSGSLLQTLDQIERIIEND